MVASYRFGTKNLTDGQTVFRLWAPSAGKVDLFIETSGISSQYPLAPEMGGWFSGKLRVSGTPCYYWFRIDDGLFVPDPASRFQPRDVHGPSLFVPPKKNSQQTNWQGRPWRDTVVYELHVGTFTPQGTLSAATAKLDYLADLGITAVELMPLADFPGLRNWGYDGVLPYAPDNSYGTIDDLRRFIEAAHARNLMVFLDVVYNHFGPEGNYLYVYAKPFFTDRHQTPWGSSIDFQGVNSQTVRRFFIENALYWLTEFDFDGLRFDAVHAIFDDSKPHILQELAQEILEGPGRQRHIHLMLENDHNNSRYLRWQTESGKKCYTAQWNDDVHHALHVLLTGENEGYYIDFFDRAIDHLGRCLTEGFAWQGERSKYRGNKPRGEPSSDLMPTRFISFLQNHDQIGNRALGERISRLTHPEALKAATAVLLLAPSIPLLFMGQEWAATSPFLFFCHFEPELAAQVTKGRRREFAAFNSFRTPRQRTLIPDPNREETFLRSALQWQELEMEEHRQWWLFHRNLLRLRQAKIVPLLDLIRKKTAFYSTLGQFSLQATWPIMDGRRLELVLNLGDTALQDIHLPSGECIHATGKTAEGEFILPPFFCGWYLSITET